METFVVSALKYRPQHFTDVVGQQAAITQTLENAISKDQLPQALLILWATWGWQNYLCAYFSQKNKVALSET